VVLSQKMSFAEKALACFATLLVIPKYFSALIREGKYLFGSKLGCFYQSLFIQNEYCLLSRTMLSSDTFDKS
jgi:hypothetical protein